MKSDDFDFPQPYSMAWLWKEQEQFPNSETVGRLDTSFECNDLSDRFGGQVLVMIGRWSVVFIANIKLIIYNTSLVQPNVLEMVAPKDCTHP